MVAELKVEIRGIESLRDFEDLPRRNALIASRAVNQVARRFRTRSGRDLREQLNFPARYLVGKEGRIELKPSNPTTLTATLSASSQARSLARFVRGSGRKGRVSVEVAPGAVRPMPGAFILGIRGANNETSNSLLAVRSPTRPRSAYRPRQLSNGLWSLYGPSIAQALLNEAGQGIWPSFEGELLAALEAEYLRQIEL